MNLPCSNRNMYIYQCILRIFMYILLIYTFPEIVMHYFISWHIYDRYWNKITYTSLIFCKRFIRILQDYVLVQNNIKIMRLKKIYFLEHNQNLRMIAANYSFNCNIYERKDFDRISVLLICRISYFTCHTMRYFILSLLIAEAY